MEVNINNINSNQEHLGKIPRYYETETLRLVKSIRILPLLDIKIFIILFKELEEYNPDILKQLEELKVILLIPKISKTIQNHIANFKSGFWYIPLTGLLMENTVSILNHEATKKKSHLITLDGDIPDIPLYGLKLDSDMVMIQNIFENKQILYSNLDNYSLVGQYDKDFGSDCEERLKYGIYDTIPMSNTCLIYSNLHWEKIYNKWWNYLIKNDKDKCDLFEEVSFDIIHPIPKRFQGLKNFQVGENYLCAKDLSANELQDIYFYHGKLLDPADIKEKLLLAIKINVYQRINKKYKG